MFIIQSIHTCHCKRSGGYLQRRNAIPTVIVTFVWACPVSSRTRVYYAQTKFKMTVGITFFANVGLVKRRHQRVVVSSGVFTLTSVFVYVFTLTSVFVYVFTLTSVFVYAFTLTSVFVYVFTLTMCSCMLLPATTTFTLEPRHEKTYLCHMRTTKAQIRRRPACASAQSDQRLCCSLPR